MKPFKQARSQDFSWGGGGVRLGSEDKNLEGIRGHAPPGKFYNFWIALDYISRVFMVKKETVEW